LGAGLADGSDHFSSRRRLGKTLFDDLTGPDHLEILHIAAAPPRPALKNHARQRLDERGARGARVLFAPGSSADSLPGVDNGPSPRLSQFY